MPAQTCAQMLLLLAQPLARKTRQRCLVLQEAKLKMPVDAHTYLGYERNSEIGPRTGLPDHKESLQVPVLACSLFVVLAQMLSPATRSSMHRAAHAWDQ